MLGVEDRGTPRAGWGQARVSRAPALPLTGHSNSPLGTRSAMAASAPAPRPLAAPHAVPPRVRHMRPLGAAAQWLVGTACFAHATMDPPLQANPGGSP